MPEDRTIYGDGVTEVNAGPELVFFRQENMLVTVSRAAMREIMLGYERLLQQEDEQG
jgi:hypothetical protein